ncbi:MAG: ATP-binding protein, partial [Muribaculaceae bacterium]|nr:ATP-binding protein [Muribaculaceae bacterium]
MENNTANTGQNPWLGLRTYTEGEVIYGRSEEIVMLTGLVLRNTQTVLYGRSGIGKSSILNAGVFPRVRRHGLVPVYIRLEHNSTTPYLEQIKAAVEQAFAPLIAEGKVKVRELAPASDGGETLWEYFHRIERTDGDGRPVRPLVVFDQFEEIFTLESKREKRDRFFRELADLINNVMPETLDTSTPNSDTSRDEETTDGLLDLGLGSLSTPAANYLQGSEFHLIFTLREDFLSYLERSTTDIPDLKNNRFCLQPINEEQAAEIILQPRKGLVSKEVAKQIIAHVTGDENFELDGVPEIQVDSAILSLYLSRLYDKMSAEGQSTITSELVEAYSDNIIEDFYADAIRGLKPETVMWLEDTLVNEDGRRDNRDRGTVLREGQLTEGELKRLTDDVKLLRQFSYGGDLRIEFIHDVLCPVVVKRRTRRNEERRIAELSAAADIAKKRARKNVIIVSLIAVGIAAAAIGAYLWNQYQYVWEISESYYHWETKNGWPVGIGPKMSKEEMSRTPFYYTLSKKGHAEKHFTSVSAGSSNEIIEDRIISTPFEFGDFIRYPELRKPIMATRRIDFTPTHDGDVDMIHFLDDDGNLLFSGKRYMTVEGENYSFTKADGTPQKLTESGADRLRLTTDSLGYITSIFYFNQEGARVYKDPNYGSSASMNINIYGYKKYVNPDSATISLISLDEYGQPVQMSTYFKTTTHYGKDGLEETEYYDINPDLAGPRYKTIKSRDFREEYAYGELTERTEFKRDSRGNIIEAPSMLDGEIQRTYYYAYDSKGRCIKRVTISNEEDTLRSITKNFNDNNELIYEARNQHGTLSYLYVKDEQPDVIKITKMDRPGSGYIETDSTHKDGSHTIFFTDLDGNPSIHHKGDIYAYKVYTRVLQDGATESMFYTIKDGQIIPESEYGYSRLIEKKDDAGRVQYYRTYDKDGKIKTSMMYFYQDGQLTGRAVMG